MGYGMPEGSNIGSEFKDWKHQFHLFQDNRGVWSCSGRLHNAELPYNALYPILLPSTHYFTQLVVRRAHIRVGHNGVKETVTELRTRYWIIKSRARVLAKKSSRFYIVLQYKNMNFFWPVLYGETVCKTLYCL